ncbi:LPS assembly protein LptD [Planctomycetota bacterium]
MTRFFSIMFVVFQLCFGFPAALNWARPEDQSGTGEKTILEEITQADFEIHHADFYDSWEDIKGVRVHMLLGNVKVTLGPYLIRTNNLVAWTKPEDPDNPQVKKVLQYYAEGDACVTRDMEYISGDAVYFDIIKDEGIVINGSLKLLAQEAGMFIYLRGDCIRGQNLSISDKRKLRAEGVTISASSYGAPFWSFRCREVEIDNSLPKNRQIKVKAASLNLWQIPVFYVPKVYKSLDNIPFKGARVGHSNEFGYFTQTDWGWSLQDWLDASVELDYYTKRGFACGLDFDWHKDGDYFGFLDTYYIPKDHGEDFDDTPLLDRERGRVHFRHRHFLPWDLRLDAEVSCINDRNFLEEYFEREAREGDPQDTYIYLRKLHENMAFTALYKKRINDFQNEVDQIPGFAANIYGQRLWETGAYWDSENEFALLRMRPDEDLEPDTIYPRHAARLHSSNRLSRPLNIHNSIWLTPWAGADYTAWDDSPQNGGVSRIAGLAGARLAGTFWRIFDYDNEAFQINGLRHIFQPEIRYTSVWGTDRDPQDVLRFTDPSAPNVFSTSHKALDVLPLNEIDNLPEGDFVKLSLRNRLQTKRPVDPEEQGDKVKMETVTFLDLDLEFSYQLDKDNNPKDMHEFATGEYNLKFLPQRDFAIYSDGEYDLRLDHIDIFNIGVDYRASERTRYFVGHRYARNDISTSEVVWKYNWSLKWSTDIYYEYDWENKGVSNSGIIFKRNFQDIIVEMGLDIDKGDDDVTVAFRLITPFDSKGRKDFFARYAFKDRYKRK